MNYVFATRNNGHAMKINIPPLKSPCYRGTEIIVVNEGLNAGMGFLIGREHDL